MPLLPGPKNWPAVFLNKKINKTRVPRNAILQQFLPLQEEYQGTEFYSDASKTASVVSCAVRGLNCEVCDTRSVTCSNFTAEVQVIFLAVNHIVRCHIPKSVICTDLPIVVQPLSSQEKSRNHIIDLVPRPIMSAYDANS